MKTHPTRTAPVTNPIPRLAPATAMVINILPLMRARLTMLRFLGVLFIAFVTTAGFGQTTRLWTNQNPAHATGAGDLGTAANWSPNGVPVPNNGPDGFGLYGDELLFDGATTGDLALTTDTGMTGASGSPWGLRVHLTANQTSAVNIYTLAAVSAGTRMQSFTVDSGAGAFRLGNTSTTTTFDMIMGGVGGQIHNFINNSANPATIHPNARWRFGGGGNHIYLFDGTGDWIVNNWLVTANNSPTSITKSGTGTMMWTSNGVAGSGYNSAIQGPLTINDGTLILKSAGLLPTTIQNITHNGVMLEYDAASQIQTFAGAISGVGPIRVKNGTLSLSGQNSFTGNILLAGGEVVVNGTETVGFSGPLGSGGIISFSGGTLRFSANNVYDYSSRFNTAPGQAYSIDSGGQSVTLATDLTSSGATLTKAGNGLLTLAGNSTYSGLTTVSGGTLAFQGTKTGSGNITVADGATLDVFATGTQVTPATLTLGAVAGANLEFDNVTSTSTAPLAAGTIVSAGTTVISINSGVFSIGQSYPLFTWTSGSAPAVSLGVVDGAGGTLSTNGNSIRFNCTSVALIWSGVNNGSWDITTGNNWTVEGSPTTYADPNQVVFNDTATGATGVTITGVVQPESVTINTSTNTYTISSSPGNNIAGSVRFSKKGSSTLTLTGGANANTGVTAIRGGTVVVGTLANGGSPSDIGAASSAAANLVLNGGALQYTGGPASIDRLFSVGTSGGTIDSTSSALTLNNTGTIGLSGTLTLTGSNPDTNTLAAALIQSGGVNKNGICTWVLTGANTYGGGTTINEGLLQVGVGGAGGTLGGGGVVNNASLLFNRTGSLLVGGAISGSGLVTKEGSGTVILANNNSYSGGTTITAGTLQVGNGGGNGRLAIGSPIVNDANLVFNTSGTFNYTGNGLISGIGNVVVQGGGRIKAIGANTYTGWTRIDSGSTFQPCEGNTGQLLSSVVTNNGTLMLVRQDNGVFIYTGAIVGSGRLLKGLNNFNPGDVTLLGTNTYTGGTFIGGGPLILGDGGTPVSGQIVGNVTFTNNFDTSDDQPRTLVFNRPDDFTNSGNIVSSFSSAQNNLGTVEQRGSGVLTLTGNNTYGGGTLINNGTLQVGAGGATGSVGTGTINNNTTLIFNRTGSLALGRHDGPGSVVKLATGTVTLTGSNYAGNVDIQAGTFGAAPSGAIGTLTVAGNLTIASGSTIMAGLDRSLSPSNSVYEVFGAIVHTSGGILRLINGGPALVVGDKFSIFSQPVPGGAAMTIVSPGFSVQNDLAVDGSVTVTGVLPPPTITATVTGTTLNLSWPSAWTGGVLVQVQTNTLAVGIANNWFTIPGTDAGNTYAAPIVKTNQTVFYRLINP